MQVSSFFAQFRIMLLKPNRALAPFVEVIWCAQIAEGSVQSAREFTLPTGCSHLVFRLRGAPIRTFRDAHDLEGETWGAAVVGGPRSRSFVRENTVASLGVGVQFRPGACAAVFGVPGDEFAERHVPAEDLLGPAAAVMSERLAVAPTPADKLHTMHGILLERLTTVTISPLVHWLVAELSNADSRVGVAELADRAGVSQRHLIHVFRGAVGLTPKSFARVQRFQRVLRDVGARPQSTWLRRAMAAGYCDQPHLNREFRRIGGFPPREYRPLPGRPNHVPLIG